jgi:hypothetical protein
MSGAMPSARATGLRPQPATRSSRSSVPIAEVELLVREAFKAGWKERNRCPGLRKQQRRSLDNALRSMIGGGRYNDVEYVPDQRAYAHSIWLNSTFRREFAQGMSAGTAETAQQAQGGARQPGPAKQDAP